MAALSDPNDLSVQTADHSTTPTPTPTNRRQGYGPNEIVSEIFSYLDFRERARCASVCKQWHEIADDDPAYLRQCRRDMPDRTSFWEKTRYNGGWKTVYIHEKISHFDAEHKRRTKSTLSYKFPYVAYANRPVIPYHEKNAGIEDHWKKKTSDDSWGVAKLLHGANENKLIPRWKIRCMAKLDKVNYDVEFELACRGFLRSEKTLWCLTEWK